MRPWNHAEVMRYFHASRAAAVSTAVVKHTCRYINDASRKISRMGFASFPKSRPRASEEKEWEVKDGRIRCLAVYCTLDKHHKSFHASSSLQAGNTIGSLSGS